MGCAFQVHLAFSLQQACGPGVLGQGSPWGRLPLPVKSDISPECKVRSNEKPVRRETKEGPFTAPASHTDRLGNKEPGHQRLVPRGLKKKKKGQEGRGCHRKCDGLPSPWGETPDWILSSDKTAPRHTHTHTHTHTATRRWGLPALALGLDAAGGWWEGQEKGGGVG